MCFPIEGECPFDFGPGSHLALARFFKNLAEMKGVNKCVPEAHKAVFETLRTGAVCDSDIVVISTEL